MSLSLEAGVVPCPPSNVLLLFRRTFRGTAKPVDVTGSTPSFREDVPLGDDSVEEEGPTKTRMIHDVRERLAQMGWRSVSVRTLVLIGGWWALTEGDRAGLAFGVPVVLLAVFTSLWLPSPRGPRWRPLGLLRFMGFFLAGSLRGGLDVAHRALAPRLPISPVIIRVAPRLPAGPARYLFIGAMNVMPGTLSVDIAGDHLDIHVLVDSGDELVRQLRALEEHIARALGERLECPSA